MFTLSSMVLCQKLTKLYGFPSLCKFLVAVNYEIRRYLSGVTFEINGINAIRTIYKKEHVSFAADKPAFKEITSKSNFSWINHYSFYHHSEHRVVLSRNSKTPYLFFIRELSSGLKKEERIS